MELKDRAFLFQSTLPARGATPLFFQHLHRHRDFNPRSPHGERPNYVLTLVEACAFQSTLPARGATLLEGNPGKQKLFQSTLPARGATLAADVEGFAHLISIHAPRTGSDRRIDGFNLRDADISIHAPRTGSDRGNPAFRPSYRNFNPRSPHGERPFSSMVFGTTRYFNPRSPHGERRAVLSQNRVRPVFQSTLPARGATQRPARAASRQQFQPTLPARGATVCADKP